jgi:hypothetical protein
MKAAVMRRVALTAALVALTAVIAGGVSMARAGSTESSDGTFTLTETQTASKFIPVNPNGAAGNEFTFHSTLSNAGGQVGTLDVLCVVVLGHNAICHASVTFKDGTINGTTLVPINNRLTTAHVSIDGGTGAYDNATGQITSVQKTAKVSQDTFDIDD